MTSFTIGDNGRTFMLTCEECDNKYVVHFLLFGWKIENANVEISNDNTIVLPKENTEEENTEVIFILEDENQQRFQLTLSNETVEFKYL